MTERIVSVYISCLTEFQKPLSSGQILLLLCIQEICENTSLLFCSAVREIFLFRRHSAIEREEESWS